MGWTGYQYVSHDAEDGAWQFHPWSGTPEEEAAVVALKVVLDRDGTISSLADLPLGWCAWREGRGQPWKRTKRE